MGRWGGGGEWGGGGGISLANLLLIAARLSTTAKNIPKSIQIPLKTVSEENVKWSCGNKFKVKASKVR